MWEIAAAIVLEGIKTFSEERRTRFKDEYHDIIKAVEAAKKDRSSNYTDAKLDLTKKRKKTFLKAYHAELKGHNNESN